VHAVMNQRQRTDRGHRFLPGSDELAAIPLIYDTADFPLEATVSHLQYFVGACDWYIAEVDDDSWLAFS
jgi:hypothetical protein